MMNRIPLLLAVLLLVFTLIIANDPLIQTPLGPIKGLKLIDTETGKTFYEFRGIRFAKAPTGHRRFKKPESVDPWTEVYNATAFGYACPQISSPAAKDGSNRQSEDCLFLNVYVPESLTEGNNLSVMVWIHGGGFMYGNGFFYDGTRLAVDGNVIVVTINYRLGLFGFLGLHHPASRGNYGLWDQILALKWVQNNIASFRGDPRSVTIFGQSGGSFSVSYLTLIPSNKGLFQRAIAQSGVTSRYLLTGKKGIAKMIGRISENTNCSSDNMNDFVDCLRETDVGLLLTASDYTPYLPKDHFLAELLYDPVVDGELFPDHPIKLLDDPNSPQSLFFSSLDFITGTTSQEGSLLYLSLMPSVQQHYNFSVSVGIPATFTCDGMIDPFVDYYYSGAQDIQDIKIDMCNFYTSNVSQDDQSNRGLDLYGDIQINPWAVDMLNYHSRLNKGTTYQYQVSRRSPEPVGYPYILPPKWYKGAGHGDELINFFRSKQRKELFNATLTEAEKDFSRTMIAYWTSFAKTGIPTAGNGSTTWQEYNSTSRMYIDFDLGNITMRQDWKSAMVKFWTEDLPPIPIDENVNIISDEISASTPASRIPDMFVQYLFMSIIFYIILVN